MSMLNWRKLDQLEFNSHKKFAFWKLDKTYQEIMVPLCWMRLCSFWFFWIRVWSLMVMKIQLNLTGLSLSYDSWPSFRLRQGCFCLFIILCRLMSWYLCGNLEWVFWRSNNGESSPHAASKYLGATTTTLPDDWAHPTCYTTFGLVVLFKQRLHEPRFLSSHSCLQFFIFLRIRTMPLSLSLLLVVILHSLAQG